MEQQKPSIEEAVPLLQRRHHNPPADDDDDQDSILHRARDAATAFMSCLSEWMILFLTFSCAMFFIPLTPDFTLQSTSVSILNVTGAGNHFSANLSLGILVDDSNPIGSSVFYDDSLKASLFHGQEKISTFTLPLLQNQEPSSAIIEAKFPNVSLKVDEWSMGNRGCGYVYLDLWLNASASFTLPIAKDKLQVHCGEVKVMLCSSSSSSVTATVVNPFQSSCDVYSDVVHRVRVVLLVMLILLLVTAIVILLLVQHFFCS